MSLYYPFLCPGIKEVVYLSDKYHDTPEMTASRRLLNMAGVQCRSVRHFFELVLLSHFLVLASSMLTVYCLCSAGVSYFVMQSSHQSGK